MRGVCVSHGGSSPTPDSKAPPAESPTAPQPVPQPLSPARSRVHATTRLAAKPPWGATSLRAPKQLRSAAPLEGPILLHPTTGCCRGHVGALQTPCLLGATQRGQGWRGDPSLLRGGGQHHARAPTGGGFGVQSGAARSQPPASMGALAKGFPLASWQRAQDLFKSNTAEQIKASADCGVPGRR